MKTLATLLVLLLSGLSSSAERYRYGNALSPRDRSSPDHDVTIIARADIGFPRAGNVTSWSIYTNGSGNVTLQIWRPILNASRTFSLVGGNRFRVEGSGLFTFEVYEGRIQTEAGDLIGLYADDGAILPYSIRTVTCPLRTLIRTDGLPSEVGRAYRFADVTTDVCRVYSVQAEVEFSTLVTTESPTSGYGSDTSTTDVTPETSPRQVTPFDGGLPEQEIPFDGQTTAYDATSGGGPLGETDVMLLNGRRPSEGIVLIRATERGIWSTLCDEGWNDHSARVVCRRLGYKDGAAKYVPYFGYLSQKYPRLPPLQCRGDETALAECQGWSGRWTNKCRMGADAGVQCFSHNIDMLHVFGYPAVERKHLEIQDSVQVIIPHPHQTLPWTSGTIRQWAFYSATDITNASNFSLQIWRRSDERHYVFVGETPIRGLTKGFHTYDLTGNDDRLHFEAGDVLGIRFEGTNPIPYDIHPGHCEAEETIDVMHLTSDLLPGQPYYFQSERSAEEGCKMFSMFVTYVGSERFGSHIFSVGHSLYKIIMYSALSWEDANDSCTRELGDRSSLVNIDTEAEYSSIVGMLNSMDITDDLWIGTRAVTDGGRGYTKWAQCHPRKGQRCAYLGRTVADEYYGYSSDVFYMFTDACESRKRFICEKTPYSVVLHGDVMTAENSKNPFDPAPGQAHHNVTIAQGQEPNIISQKVKEREAPSILVAPVTTAVLLFTCLAVFILLHLYRRQRRKHSRDDEVSESTVRFISLYDKAANSSMDC